MHIETYTYIDRQILLQYFFSKKLKGWVNSIGVLVSLDHPLEN